jgi:hypothetical protein
MPESLKEHSSGMAISVPATKFAHRFFCSVIPIDCSRVISSEASCIRVNLGR